MKASRIILWTIPVLIIALGGGGWRYARAMTPQLELGTAYAARVGCACRYIGNRAIGQCRADFEPGMALIRLSDDPATKTVTAWVPLVAHRSATFDPILGCQSERFRGMPLKVH